MFKTEIIYKVITILESSNFYIVFKNLVVMHKNEHYKKLSKTTFTMKDECN